MKKKNRIYIIVISLALLAGVTLSGCRQETIFYQIEKETELEEAVIKGSVFSIVAFSNKIYATDGRIYAKNKEDGNGDGVIRGWQEITSPRSDSNPYSSVIIKLAADSTRLYALAAEKQNKTSDETLVLFYSADAVNWTQTAWSNPAKTVSTIFSDNNGNAYLRQETAVNDSTAISYFSLNGNTITPTAAVSSYIIDASNSGKKTYYVNSEGKISDGTNTVSEGVVYSLSYSPKTDSLYAGTSGGIKKLTLNSADGSLTGDTADVPGSNLSSTIKSYQIFAVYATEYTLSGTNYEAIYASTIAEGSSYANINGLWGYYESRGTWNRE